mgnify:CR=1 FL=1
MTDYPSMDRLAELQQLIADFAKVERVPQLADTGRPENDVEHSYGLAITCWFLHDKIAPELNLLKILQYSLSHDLVEIYAGDTFAFGEDKAFIESKEARERDAITTLRKTLPDFPQVVDYSEGYMDKIDEEAKFVKAIDKILPLLMIELKEGKAYWDRYNITIAALEENKKPILISDAVAPYYKKNI